MVVLLAMSREAGTAAWKRSKRFHFVLRALRLQLSAASLQGGPHPGARSLVCQLGWTLDWSRLDLRLFSLALSRSHPVSILVLSR